MTKMPLCCLASIAACLLMSACIKEPTCEEPYHPPVDSTVCDAQSLIVSVSDMACPQYSGYIRMYKTYAPDGTIRYMQVTVGAFDQKETYHVKILYANNGKKLFLLDSASLDTVFRASLDMQNRAVSSQLRHPHDAGWYPQQTYTYNSFNRINNIAQFKFTYDVNGDPATMIDTINGGGMGWSHVFDEIPIKGAYYLTEGYLGITDNVEILSYLGHIDTQPRYRVELISSSYPGNTFLREVQGQTQSPPGYINWTYGAYCLEGEMTGSDAVVNWRCPASAGGSGVVVSDK